MTYDLEDDIGLIAEDATAAVAARNTERLSAALCAMHSAGQFRFRDGKVGPVLHPITAAGKEFYFAGTPHTAICAGGKLTGTGGRCPTIPKAHFQGHLGGMVTRFTRIDGDKGGACFRIRNTGFILEGIQFQGAPYNVADNVNGPSGPKTPVGIEVEGRLGPPTGGCAIRDCSISYCQYGICLRRGYYDDAGKFVEDESMGDTGTVEDIFFGNCDSCLRCENIQACQWRFLGFAAGGFGKKHCILFDLDRPTTLIADRVLVGVHNSTLIRVTNAFSPFVASVDIRDVKWDGGVRGPDDSIRLLHYDGPAEPAYDLRDAKWRMRITGQISYLNEQWVNGLDVSKFIDVAPKFPLDNILLDIYLLDNMPGAKGRFQSAPNGPWVRPTSEWIK